MNAMNKAAASQKAPALKGRATSARKAKAASRIDVRRAVPGDGEAIHTLIASNLEVGHLLPRDLEDVRHHVSRFFVVTAKGRVIGCADLAPLSRDIAEIRSLVIDEAHRGGGLGTRLVEEVKRSALQESFTTLCAFTHQPSHFVRLGFSIVPHVWVPEKIATDCHSCAWFRRCGQYAMWLALRPESTRRHRPVRRSWAPPPDTATYDFIPLALSTVGA